MSAGLSYNNRTMLPPYLDRWPAPAKLNLFLHITGRRADGYHMLQTVFQFLDYGDELAFEVTADRRITRATFVPGIAEESDLCVRAARILQDACGTELGAVIHINKRIPQGGGLGGGSSDAATTLLALNRLWGVNLPYARLAELALRLGADVPVFVLGRSAWAEGVGEVLTPIDLPQPWYVILVPPVLVSTAAVFAEFDCDVDTHLTGYSKPITIRDFHGGRASNDLQTVVRRLYPEVDKALKWLENFGDARMTGSGSCLFLPVADEAGAQEIIKRCPVGFAKALAVRGVNLHPIHQRDGND